MAIGKLANANAKAYRLAITDSLPNIVSDLSALNGNSHISSLTATSGAATLSGGATIAAPAFILDSGTTLTVSENLSYSGSFTNAGTLEMSGSGDVATIDAAFNNTGTVSARAGTLDLAGAVTGKGTDTISGAATLEFGAGVSSATTLGSQNIAFSIGGGTLDLLAPTSFYGEVSGFAAGDTVELLGSWGFSGISQAGGVTTLTLANNGTTHGFEFAGDYTQSNFNITPGTTTTITYQA
jgi:hypothetical protein